MKRFFLLPLCLLVLGTTSPLFAQDEQAEAPPIFFTATGSGGTESYDVSSISGSTGGGLSFSERGDLRGGSATVSLGETTASVSSNVYVRDEGGSFTADWRYQTPRTGDYWWCGALSEFWWNAQLGNTVTIYVQAGLADSYDIVETKSGSIEISGGPGIRIGSFAGNSYSLKTDTGGETGEPSFSDSKTDKEVRPRSCSYSFPEFPGVSYCKLAQRNYGSSANMYDWRCYSLENDGEANSTGSASLAVIPNESEPDPDDDCEQECFGDTVIYKCSGNVRHKGADPVRTRGYPIRNNIYINTQDTEYGRAMGNATFSYDAHILTDTWLDHTRHLVLVDGDGRRFNYGHPDGDLTPPRGAYGRLSRVGRKYKLDGAGPLGQLGDAGNFTYYFNAIGQLIEVIDPAGNRQVLRYKEDKLQQIQDISSGRHTDFVWNDEPFAKDRIIKVIENDGGAATELKYTVEGYLSRLVVLNEDGSIARALKYRYRGRFLASITEDEDPESNIEIKYEFKVSRRNGKKIPYANIKRGKRETRLSRLTYKSKKRRVQSQNIKGGVTTYYYNEHNDLYQIATPRSQGRYGGPPITIEYDDKGNRTKIVGEEDTTTFAYNEFGKVTRIETGGEFRAFTYNGVDITSVSDNSGLVATYKYEDPALPHHVTAVLNSAGEQWRYTYNRHGQITASIPPAGSSLGTTTYEYYESGPAFGYPKRIVDGTGRETLFKAYTKLGDLMSSQDGATGETVQSTYDARHRETSRSYDDGSTYTWGYDGAHLGATVDELGTRYDYDFCKGCGGLEKVSGPLEWTLKYDRDDDGDVKSFTDARGNATKYSYHRDRTLSSAYLPDGFSERYYYDQAGRYQSKVRRWSTIERYTYNDAGRITEQWNKGYSATTYSYTPDGRLAKVVEPVGTTTYAYDKARRVKSIDYDYTASGLEQVQTLTFTYLPGGLLKELEWKSGSAIAAKWAYQYDGVGRLTQVKNHLGAVVDFGYDKEGQLSKVQHGNGVSTTYRYDKARDWIVSLFHKTGSSGRFIPSMFFLVKRDASGKITEIVAGGRAAKSGKTKYRYDDLYRLVSEESESASHSYGYDLAGNLTSLDAEEFATYDAGNKIASMNGTRVSYSNGNAYQFGNEYNSWDEQHKLTQRRIDWKRTITYGYNHQGLRVWREEEGKRKFFIFVGETLLGEIAGDGSPSTVYTWGAHGIASFAREGKQYIPLQGVRAEVVALADEGGKIAWQTQYDAYGNQTGGPGGFENPVAFAGAVGCYTDAGLVLCGQRWYSPELRRWLSRDPSGYAGGVNLYEYVGADPVNWVDPDGAHRKEGKTPPGRWPKLPRNIGGKKPKWNSKGYWEPGKGGRPGGKLTWDDRSHGTGRDRGVGLQGGHWDDENSNNRWDEEGNPLPGSEDFVEEKEKKERIDNKEFSCNSECAIVKAGAMTAGIYLTYRCVRMVPSLFPPLWPSIPANVVVP